MSDINKGFFAILPANIRYDNGIPSYAKLLYSEITALCNEKGYCWANNEYFSELYGVSERTIRRWINLLASKGYIIIEFQYRAETKEIQKRYIKLAGNSESVSDENACLGMDKNVHTCGQKCPTGGDKNVRENNIIYNNNIINNSYSHFEPDESKKPPKKTDCEMVVDLYSQICTKLPKVIKITENRRKAIKKLLEMFTIEQIETAFKIINDSSFCTGVNDRGWKADFDFCINTNKITNALEGKYNNSFTNNANQSNAKPANKTNKFHNFMKSDDLSESEMEAIARKRAEKFIKDIKQRRARDE